MKTIMDEHYGELKLVPMTHDDTKEEIEFEDQCGVNDLLQALIYTQDNPKAIFYRKINSFGENCGWCVLDKDTGEDLHL